MAAWRGRVWGAALLAAGLAGPSGAALAQPCAKPADCAAGRYCDQPIGQCAATGTCASLDFLCPALADPACGCDGHTYGNECLARAHRVSIAHPGSCCTGACVDPSAVSVADLIVGIDLGLGIRPGTACRSFDRDGNQRVTIDELIAAVTHALYGCPR
jgi:Kazal-type serine protease inhibitor domain